MSQNQRLLNYLQKHSGIHPLEAWVQLGLYRLSARVKDLRDAGHNITSERREVLNQFGEKCRVAFYRLGK
jgi:hypothetical protein